MNWITKSYYEFHRIWQEATLYMVLASPGLVVMVADNDAGGINNYSVSGAKYDFFK